MPDDCKHTRWSQRSGEKCPDCERFIFEYNTLIPVAAEDADKAALGFAEYCRRLAAASGEDQAVSEK